MPYPAGAFPALSSFSASPICPNGSSYVTNQNGGLSLAQMMAATNPPTSWSPATQAADHLSPVATRAKVEPPEQE
jgi:hypothetical protein